MRKMNIFQLLVESKWYGNQRSFIVRHCAMLGLSFGVPCTPLINKKRHKTKIINI